MSRTKTLVLISVLILALVIRYMLFFQNQKTYLNGEKYIARIRITEEPQQKFGKQQFHIQAKNGGKILLSTGQNPKFLYGDRIKISGIISQANYKEHRYTIIKNPDIQYDTSDQNFITSSATYIRRKAKVLYQNSLSPVSASLLSGIVFGGNQGMPDKFMKQLRNTGVVHVIAASGMNVTFVAGALIGLLGKFFRRQIALTIAIFGVIFYAYLAGFEASIIRASLMAIIGFSAGIFGRQNIGLIALVITGYIMIIWNPDILSDVGFQLSFLATLGILVIKPLFSQGKNILIDDLTTTISAQITTLPVLLSVFGQFGILSILVNALVLWTVPVLMILGSLALLLGMILEPLARVVLLLSEPILYFFEKVVIYFGNLGWTVTIPSVSPAIWIGYYFLLLAIIFLIRRIRAKNELRPVNLRETFLKN